MEIQNEMNGSQYFMASELPQLPDASPTLRKLLNDYRSQNSSLVTSRKRKKSPGSNRITKRSTSKRRRSLNGFMAFRSFYSQNIDTYKSQKDLSSALAKVWNLEKNQNIWNRYAAEYNISCTTASFVSWLKLKLGQRNLEIEKLADSTWCQVSIISDLIVEDIYHRA
uniref:Putative transcription factor n=1 Tax=Ogataea minuta TaxID=36026 RepID=A0A348AZ71_9ASCO|nr:putative transcription factor [Ogataea minuta]